MKKMFLAFILGSIGCTVLFASNSDLFTYNREYLEQQLDALTNLESRINENPALLNELCNQEYGIETSGIMMSANYKGEDMGDKNPVFNIPSFCWGFCFSVPGIILVHVVTDDYSESKKAFNGCVVMFISSTALYIFYYILVLLSVVSFSYY